MALYDLGVLVYFFVFVFAMFRNVTGFSLSYQCQPCSWNAWDAAASQIAYIWLAIQYALCWSCIQACASWVDGCRGSCNPFHWFRNSSRDSESRASSVGLGVVPP